MKMLSLYRILTYILLPIAGIFGAIDILFLFAGLAQPALLLGVFILAAMVIYVFISFIFLSKGIERSIPLKPSTKDWLKVNAYVTVGFVALNIIQAIGLLRSDATVKQVITDSIAMQGAKLPPGYTIESLMKIIRGAIYFLLTFSGILLIHLSITFRLLKAYAHVFDKE